jgi:hypothetical protein
MFQKFLISQVGHSPASYQYDQLTPSLEPHIPRSEQAPPTPHVNIPKIEVPRIQVPKIELPKVPHVDIPKLPAVPHINIPKPPKPHCK